MKKIPSTIRVKRGVTYEVVFTDIIVENEKTLAECRKDFKQIVIKNGQTELENWACFIHEFLHMLEFEFNIPLAHKLVYKLEKFILKVLVLNGWLD